MSDEAVSFTCFECSMFSVPLKKMEDVKFGEHIILEVLKPPPTFQLTYDYNWSEIEGNSEACIGPSGKHSWISGCMFFFSNGILDEYNLFNIFPACTVPWGPVTGWWSFATQETGGKLSIQHSASTAVMKHDFGLQHSGSKLRHADFKEKLVRKWFSYMLEKYDLLSSIGGMLATRQLLENHSFRWKLAPGRGSVNPTSTAFGSHES